MELWICVVVDLYSCVFVYLCIYVCVDLWICEVVELCSCGVVELYSYVVI